MNESLGVTPTDLSFGLCVWEQWAWALGVIWHGACESVNMFVCMWGNLDDMVRAVVCDYLRGDSTVALWAVPLYIQTLSNAYKHTLSLVALLHLRTFAAGTDCEDQYLLVNLQYFPVLLKLLETLVTENAACNLQTVCWHLLQTYEEHARWVMSWFLPV